ncbi:MAG: NYN domain-containing protein [Lachnospiraceae bacterium]|jgi:uncharacterized protein (TIGR00288 family)|nr:NYN domain-containing protein [Lachnospiraceae bacterium]
MDDKRFALLIDSDNISAAYINSILDELSQYGVVSYKRIYGDWNSSNSKKWRAVLSDYALQPMQQFANVKGKNATDSFMIIDAMDILYSDTVDGFCLVTSDSDFTRLAARLRESGKIVIGMGESKTHRAFVSACDAFVNLENFKPEKQETSTGKLKEEDKEFTIQSKDEIAKWIQSILVNMDGRRMSVGEIGERLRRRYSDFDYRNYDYKGHKCNNLSTFLESIDTLFLQKNGNNLDVTSAMLGKTNVKKVIIELLTKNGELEISLFGKKLKEKVPDFNVKDYNCSQLKKFVASLTFLDIIESNDGKSHAVCLKK